MPWLSNTCQATSLSARQTMFSKESWAWTEAVGCGANRPPP
jgi:hypothetical protein